MDLNEVNRFSKTPCLLEYICVASKLQLSLKVRILEEMRALEVYFPLVVVK